MSEPSDARVAVYIDFDNIIISRYDQIHGRGAFHKHKAKNLAVQAPDTAADVRLRILEGRRRTVERQREGLRASLSRTRERLDRYTLELQRHGLESVDREVRWLAELIDRELTDSHQRRADGAEPGDPPQTSQRP